jgi:hypothetical protein
MVISVGFFCWADEEETAKTREDATIKKIFIVENQSPHPSRRKVKLSEINASPQDHKAF